MAAPRTRRLPSRDADAEIRADASTMSWPWYAGTELALRTLISKVFDYSAAGHWVARTCSTSLVPGRARSAPKGAVGRGVASPQTIVCGRRQAELGGRSVDDPRCSCRCVEGARFGAALLDRLQEIGDLHVLLRWKARGVVWMMWSIVATGMRPGRPDFQAALADPRKACGEVI